MAILQSEFTSFHQKICLNDIEDNKPLRDKRDMLIKELYDWCRTNKKPSFDWFNQGSYSMRTGIVPQEGDDYDIDVAIVFNIKIDDYDDPVEVKKWVRDALKKGKREVDILGPCVRVQYRQEGELKYHVDFAIYGKEFDQAGNEIYKCLARGKEFAAKEKRFWERAEPERLKSLINKELFQGEALEGEKRAQFRRVVRYFKRWKDHNFPSTGDARPTGIAMTAICYEWFYPNTRKDWEGKILEEDLYAFQAVVRQALDNNYGLGVRLPVIPHNDLFAKLKKSNGSTQNYKDKLQALYDALNAANREPDPHEAAKLLEPVLGPDFTIPEKKDTAVKTAAPAITTSSISG